MRGRDPRAPHRARARSGRASRHEGRRRPREKVCPREQRRHRRRSRSASCAAGATTAAAQTTTTEPGSDPVAPAGRTRGVTDTSIKVGGLGYSFVYGGADIGAKARFQRANDAGGVNGRTIDYLGFTDDGGDPTAGTAAATKLVEQDGVFAVVPTVTPDLAASTYLVDQKVPYFGWALSSNFCGNPYGFGFTGCPVPKNATSNAWPLLIGKVFPNGRDGSRGRDRGREHAVRGSTTSAR